MLLLSSLFVFLGMGTVQTVANVPVQVIEHVSSTRYQFEYQENAYIIDLNAKRKILAYYIENELQNPSLLPSTQKELLQYDKKSKWDLAETFDVIPSDFSRSQEITTEQSVADISVQVTEHVSSTRYQFKYQENAYIIDLNAERKILAYYIDNKLQNPSLLALIQKELLQYDEKSKWDLAATLNYAPKRTRRSNRWGSRRRIETPGEAWRKTRGGKWRNTRSGTWHSTRGEAWQKDWWGKMSWRPRGGTWIKIRGEEWRRTREGMWWRARGETWQKIREKTQHETRVKTHIERKNNPGINIKIDSGYLGERLMDVGSLLAETGVPHAVAFGTGLAALGFFLSWFN